MTTTEVNNILAVLMIINISVASAALSMLGINLYAVQKTSATNSIQTRNAINHKLDMIATNLGTILGEFANVTARLANNTHAINATLHNLQGNQSAALHNATGFYH